MENNANGRGLIMRLKDADCKNCYKCVRFCPVPCCTAEAKAARKAQFAAAKKAAIAARNSAK